MTENSMDFYIKIDACLFMYNMNCSLRCAAENFCVPRSTLHRFLHTEFKTYNNEIYHEILSQQKRRKHNRY